MKGSQRQLSRTAPPMSYSSQSPRFTGDSADSLSPAGSNQHLVSIALSGWFSNHRDIYTQ